MHISLFDFIIFECFVYSQGHVWKGHVLVLGKWFNIMNLEGQYDYQASKNVQNEHSAIVAYML